MGVRGRTRASRTSRGAVALAARLLLTASLAVPGLGCDAEPGGPSAAPAAVPATTLALGRLSDARAFTPYAPGEELEIHRGPQGGTHVWMDGVLEGDALDDECLVTLRVRRADDDTEVATIQHLRAPDRKPDAEGRQTLEQLIVFIPDPIAVDGVEVIVQAELMLDDAILEGDEVLVRLRWAGE